MNMTGAQSMVRCLEEEDVSHIFGYPGATICPFYEALYHSESIQHILVRQEQSAAHMASGYARITGKAGVCVVTSGPGATNLITGIATAYMDSIPLVAITGQVQSYLLGRDIFQEVDITGAVSPFIKHTYLIKKAEDIPRIFKEAFHIATTGRPGPVLIDVPIDMQEAEIDFSYPEEVNIRGYKPTINGNLKQLKKVVKTIAAAERPLICVGGGAFCAKAQEQVRQLCEETKIPMVTTMMGLGALPTSHPLNIGMIGSFGHKTANMALSQTDLLILVGARVGDRAITAPEKISSQSKTIHIDIDPAEIGKNVNPTVPLVGDLRAVLESLLAEHPISNCSHWSEYLQQEAAAEKATMPDPRPDTIQPKRLMAEIGKQITADACVVADVGQNQIWAAKYLPMRQGRFLTTGGLGTMGYALPAAIGVKIAAPEKQTIVVCGDGAFQMTNNELSTMVEQGCDVKIVLLNNRTLGMVCELQRIAKRHKFAVALPDTPDFGKLADAFGVKSRRISQDADMADAIAEMLAYDGPYLLECVVSEAENSKVNM